MQTITTIGLDIAKSVFQVHGVDAGGQVIVRRQLKRRYQLWSALRISPTMTDSEWQLPRKNRANVQQAARFKKNSTNILLGMSALLLSLRARSLSLLSAAGFTEAPTKTARMRFGTVLNIKPTTLAPVRSSLG
jgi:hypothetical protein